MLVFRFGSGQAMELMSLRKGEIKRFSVRRSGFAVLLIEKGRNGVNLIEIIAAG